MAKLEETMKLKIAVGLGVVAVVAAGSAYTLWQRLAEIIEEFESVAESDLRRF